jgi:hypothetical protein
MKKPVMAAVKQTVERRRDGRTFAVAIYPPNESPEHLTARMYFKQYEGKEEDPEGPPHKKLMEDSGARRHRFKVGGGAVSDDGGETVQLTWKSGWSHFGPELKTQANAMARGVAMELRDLATLCAREGLSLEHANADITAAIKNMWKNSSSQMCHEILSTAAAHELEAASVAMAQEFSNIFSEVGSITIARLYWENLWDGDFRPQKEGAASMLNVAALQQLVSWMEEEQVIIDKNLHMLLFLGKSNLMTTREGGVAMAQLLGRYEQVSYVNLEVVTLAALKAMAEAAQYRPQGNQGLMFDLWSLDATAPEAVKSICQDLFNKKFWIVNTGLVYGDCPHPDWLTEMHKKSEAHHKSNEAR